MLTDLGKVLRKIRIDRDEILKDMAAKLKVTVAYLSAVENGKRDVPEEWPEKITKLYSLDENEEENLREAAFSSKKSIKIKLDEESERDRDLVLAFARRFRELDDTEVDTVKRLLERNRGV